MTGNPSANSWIVYILECTDNSLYTGITNNLENRLNAHNNGTAAKYTRSRLPVQVIYKETAADRPAALRREAAIKKLSRTDKLLLINSSSG